MDLSAENITVKVEPNIELLTDENEIADDAIPAMEALDFSKQSTSPVENAQEAGASEALPEFVNIKMEVDSDENNEELSTDSESDTEDLVPLSSLCSSQPKIKQEQAGDVTPKLILETVVKVEPLDENADNDNDSQSNPSLQDSNQEPIKIIIKHEVHEDEEFIEGEDEDDDDGEQRKVTEEDLDENASVDGKYMCPICQRRFATKGLVQRHQLLHRKDKLECPVCSRKFIKEWHLKQHIISHSDRRYDCSDCGKNFNSTSNLRQHRRTHLEVKPFKCEKCQREFTVRGNYLKHLGKSRCKLPDNEPIVCNICKKVFKSQYLLQSHLRRHTTERPYTCEICNMSYKYKSTVIRHIQLHKGEKPYSCKICSKTFTHAGLIKPHMRKHTGEKPFTCPICSKLFAHKHNMERHAQRHAKVKRLVCEICYRKFPKESRLKYHMRTHVKEKPFPCKICTKQFSHKQNALRHYERKHPGEVYTNELTDASYARDIWEQVVANNVKLEPMKTANGCSQDEYVLP